MSIRVTKIVRKHSKARLSNFSVLLGLADHAHPDGTNAFPSHATLSEECHISERQVRKSLDALKAMGEIVPTGKKGRTVIYRITLADKAAESAGMDPRDAGDIAAPSVDIAAQPAKHSGTFGQHSGTRVPTNRQEPSSEPRENRHLLVKESSDSAEGSSLNHQPSSAAGKGKGRKARKGAKARRFGDVLGDLTPSSPSPDWAAA